MERRIKKIVEQLKFENKKTNSFSTQELVKKIRKLNEENNNRKTSQDQSREENNFRNAFDDLNVVVDFIDLEVYDNLVFWGGTIDGIVQFAYKVTPEENTSGIEFNYLEDFSVDNPDNEEIIKRIEKYYDQFYKYWRDNIFQN
jgi:hypothetical protein